MKDQNMPCGHNWSDYVSCDTDNGTYMCGKCSPIGMRVAQLKADLQRHEDAIRHYPDSYLGKIFFQGVECGKKQLGDREESSVASNDNPEK